LAAAIRLSLGTVAAAALVGVRVLLLLAAAALACLVLVAMLLAQLPEQPVQMAGLLAEHPAQLQHRQISVAAAVAHVHLRELKGRLAGHLFQGAEAGPPALAKLPHRLILPVFRAVRTEHLFWMPPGEV